jgi:hypothetical protein
MELLKIGNVVINLDAISDAAYDPRFEDQPRPGMPIRKRVLTIRFIGSSNEALVRNFSDEEADAVWARLKERSTDLPLTPKPAVTSA